MVSGDNFAFKLRNIQGTESTGVIITIINIRGTSGSGKSTLVQKFLQFHPHDPIVNTLSDWKKEKIVAYRCSHYGKPDWQTFVLGRYETQCGGWDAMSYKGSHEDLEQMAMAAAAKGHVIFEGLTVSSSYTRWLNVSKAYPGSMVFCFMDTPEQVCYERILARNGGREPKRDAKGLADYNHKFRNSVVQSAKLEAMGERVVWLSSDTNGYNKLLELLGE